MKPRIEKDSLGIIKVPGNRLYGAQTARALVNFGMPIAGFSLSERPSLIRALVKIKRASAEANYHIGDLEKSQYIKIRRACDELLKWTDYSKDFPIHILHGGGGTSANMNVNEVIANLANSFEGQPFGSYLPLDPLDHINRNQSTNDVYPSACRISVAENAQTLIKVLENCIGEFGQLKTKFGHIPKVVRTCLQDAVASDWGRYFGAQINVLTRHRDRMVKSLKGLVALNVGGGVAGEPRSSPPRFRREVIQALADSYPSLSIAQTGDFADAAQNSDDLIDYAHSIDGLCRTLIKQSCDMRLLASGPECGFMELLLPARQCGSTAMPGKVNPVLPEFSMQCSFAAIGYIVTCGLAAEHAELDLNVWEGTFVHSLLTASDLLRSSIDCLNHFCLVGLTINEIESRKKANNSTARATSDARRTSYSAALNRLRDSKEADRNQ